MDDLQRYCLRKHRDAISLDLDPIYVLPELLNRRVLTNQDADQVLNQCTRELRTAKLLDILPRKGGDAFEGFVGALVKDSSYPWLARKLTECTETAGHDERKADDGVYNVLLSGGVPFPVSHLIRRDEKLEEIRVALRAVASSERGRGWVVVHGMTGSGKTVLAAEALRDSRLVRECFPDGVWWVALGHVDPSGLLVKMQTLCDKVDTQRRPLPNNVEMATNRLKRLVAEENKFLIVLDDVWSDEAVHAFDVGCPVAVTTKDASVVSAVSGRVEKVSVHQELELDETKSLLAMAVKVDESELPEDVETIHRKCKGLPLLVAMVGGLMKPHGNKIERWKDCVKKLETREIKDIRRRRLSGNRESINQTIAMSIDYLDPELADCYRDLALFVDDVSIPVKVLQILWDKDRLEVEDIMFDLAQKCLVQKVAEKDGTSLYSIHDLHLDYLQNTCQDIPGLHKKLIARYREYGQNDGSGDGTEFARLPDDGYIYYFLAYHLGKAKMTNLFPTIFLNLDFIQHKLRFTGPSDLLHDFEHYKEHFGQVEKELADVSKFVRQNAHVLSNPGVDPIQLALCQPVTSTVHQKARKMALTRRKKFYFDWCNMANVPQYPLLSTRLHTGAVNCAVFSPDDKTVASAGEDRLLRLWDSSSGKLLKVFAGHTSTIWCCTFSRNGTLLATASADRTVKLWNVPKDLSDENGTKRSPRPRSGSFQWPTKEGVDESCATFGGHRDEVRWCAFSSDGSRVVSGDSSGVALVWETSACQQKFTLKHRYEITCCCFSPDDGLVATASADNSVVLWDADRGECRATLRHEMAEVVACHFSRDGTRLVTAAGGYVWQWDVTNGCQVRRYFGLNNTYYITTCSLAPDETYVAGGTSERVIHIWPVGNSKVATTLVGHCDVVQRVSFSHDGRKLVSACGDGTVMIWNTAKRFGSSTVRLTKDFTVRFRDGAPLTAVADTSGKIKVFKGLDGKEVSKHCCEMEEIKCCTLSPDCSSVIYGTDSGTVVIYNIQFEDSTELPKKHKGPVTSCVFSDTTGTFITGSDDHTLKIWRDGSIVSCYGHNGAVVMCKAVPDKSKLVSCGADGRIIVWCMQTGEALLIIDGHQGNTVTCCDVYDNIVASGSVDKVVKLWKLDGGNDCGYFDFGECVRCCRFSPDGRNIAVGDDAGVVWLCNYADGPTKTKLGSHDGPSWVNAIEFNSVGSQLVSVADCIKWWTSGGELLQSFQIQGSSMHRIFASADFRIFVTVSDAGVLYILKRIEDDADG